MIRILLPNGSAFASDSIEQPPVQTLSRPSIQSVNGASRGSYGVRTQVLPAHRVQCITSLCGANPLECLYGDEVDIRRLGTLNHLACAANTFTVIVFLVAYRYLWPSAESGNDWRHFAAATVFFTAMLIGPVLSTAVILKNLRPV